MLYALYVDSPLAALMSVGKRVALPLIKQHVLPWLNQQFKKRLPKIHKTIKDVLQPIGINLDGTEPSSELLTQASRDPKSITSGLASSNKIVPFDTVSVQSLRTVLYPETYSERIP
jgi:hypothetical protein